MYGNFSRMKNSLDQYFFTTNYLSLFLLSSIRHFLQQILNDYRISFHLFFNQVSAYSSKPFTQRNMHEKFPHIFKELSTQNVV
jgi:hypothetical protein